MPDTHLNSLKVNGNVQATSITNTGNETVSGNLTVTGSIAGTMTPTSNAVTATNDGLTTGIVPAGTTYSLVTSASASNIVTLPAPVPGHRVKLWVTTNGYKLQSSAPSTIAINNVTGAAVKATIPANTLSILECTSATTWLLMSLTALGAVGTAIVPA